jgi:hypothetical protein
MSFALEFHDSEVRDVVADGDRVRIRFSAAAVRGAAGERGWLPSVVLSLAQATLVGDATQAFGKVADGALRQDSHNAPRLALPGTLPGAIELTLRFANGTLLTVQALALVLTVADDARFAADLSC